MDKIQPCPFCRRHATLITLHGAGRPEYKEIGPAVKYWVECASCFARGPVAIIDFHAVERWNHRRGTIPIVDIPIKMGTPTREDL